MSVVAHAGRPEEDGWLSAVALRSGADLDELLERVGRWAGCDRPDVQVSLFADAYAWALCTPAVTALLEDRRLPTMTRDAVAVRFGADGRARQVGFGAPRFLALAEDPAIEHPDAELVDDEDALLARLRDGLEIHLAPLVAVLHARGRRPARALWRGAADQLAAAFLWAGEALDKRADAWTLGERALALPGPLQGKPGYRVLAGEPIRVRQGCCLWWRTGAGRPCLTCPLVPDAERRARLTSRA